MRLRRLVCGSDLRVWAKLEGANPGGSAKDRGAERILADAWERGEITERSTVVESSSGNMGVGLAQACRYRGLRFVCVADIRTTRRNLKTMEALGAEVVIVEGDGEATDLLAKRLATVARILAETPESFWPDQYANEAAVAAARGTMEEIDSALNEELDHLFVATSTTGTLRGCAEWLRDHGRSTEVVAVDARGSALFGGSSSRRLIPGLGAGVPTPLSERARPDRLVRVSDLDCVVGCRRLAEREALLAGGSSGGVAHAFGQLSRHMEPGSSCALIFADGGSGYLETVFDDEWVGRELGCSPATLAALVDADGPQ